MILSKEEFLNKHKNVIESGIVTEEYVDDVLDMIMEMAKSDERAVRSQIRRIFHHMLKFEYQKERQSRSWINTIRGACRELEDYKKSSKAIWNSFGDDHLDDIYKDAVRDAVSETKLPKSTFPTNRPSHFTKDNISDYSYMEYYMTNYAYSNVAKSLLL